MERILTRREFGRSLEGTLGRDKWFPLDEVGLKWGDVGNPFGVGGYLSVCLTYLGDGIVLCGDASGGADPNVIARSIDYGVTWRNLGGFTTTYVMGIAYLGGGVAVVVHMNGHVLRSTDHGAGWTDLGDQTGGGNLSAVASLGNGIAIAAMAGAASVLRTVDYGQTWAIIAAPVPVSWMRWVMYLGKGVVLVGGQGISVNRSQDYGLTWSNISAQFPGQTATWRAANIGDGVALIATAERHLWRTEDYGLTWQDQGTIPGATGLIPLCYCGNGIVLAGIGGLMLARSIDYGRTWTPIGAVPGGTSVTGIAYLERGIVLTSGYDPRVNRSEPAMQVE